MITASEAREIKVDIDDIIITEELQEALDYIEKEIIDTAKNGEHVVRFVNMLNWKIERILRYHGYTVNRFGTDGTISWNR